MLRWVAALAVSVVLAGSAAAEPVDLELVFAADGSGSIDEDELRLQRRGWAEALTSKDVLAGIRDGRPAPSPSPTWNGAGRRARF